MKNILFKIMMAFIVISTTMYSCTKESTSGDPISQFTNEKISQNEDGTVSVSFVNCPDHYSTIQNADIAISPKEFNEIVTFLAPRTGLSAQAIHDYLPSADNRPKYSNDERTSLPATLIRARSKTGNTTLKYKTWSNQANTIWLLQHMGQNFSDVIPQGETDWGLDFYTQTWAGVNSKNKITPQDVFNSAISSNNSNQFTTFDPSTSLSFADATRFDSAYMATLLEDVTVDGLVVASAGDIVFVHFTASDEVLDEESNPAIVSFADLNSCRYEIVASTGVVTNIWQG